MSTNKNRLPSETELRITKLENELEEFRSGVTEENLKLQTPYVKDSGRCGLAFKKDSEDNLEVYANGVKLGKIILTV